MPKYRMLGLMVIVWSGLALASGEQNKPVTPQNRPVTPPVAPPVEKQRQQAPSQRQPASQEQNKAVVRRVFDELFSRGRYESIDEIYAKDCPVHFGNRNNRLEEAVAEGKGWRSAAPDLLMTADRIVADGDRVTVDWTARGTHTGKGNGIAPTGKRILIHGKSTFRLVNGKIVEVWNSDHRDELFRQLGVPRTLARLYEMGEDFWVAVNRFFSSKDPVAASVPPSQY